MSGWKIYAGIIAIIAFFIGIYVYGSIYTENQRRNGARIAKGVVIEKNFAPAQSVTGISSDGSYGLGSTEDRYIVAVRATEGATGLKEIDVPKNIYYRLSVGTEVKLIISMGDLSDEGKYRVEIDPSSIPTPASTSAPAQMQPPSDDLINAKGQIRK